MVNKQKLYSITLVSAAMFSMLLNTAGSEPFADITNYYGYNVSVIDTATNNITTNVTGLNHPYGIAVFSDGTKEYLTNKGNNTVSVNNTTTNKATATVPVGLELYGVAVTPDGEDVYVVNVGSYTAPSIVSVINTTTNKVTTNVTVGSRPVAFG
jgi:YVTN family beta-propeller protein